MHVPLGGCSRRGFLASALAVGALPSAAASAAPTTWGLQTAGRAIDALGLDAATRAELEVFAQPVLRETAWLAELPLDEFAPAFVFGRDARRRRSPLPGGHRLASPPSAGGTVSRRQDPVEGFTTFAL